MLLLWLELQLDIDQLQLKLVFNCDDNVVVSLAFEAILLTMKVTVCFGTVGVVVPCGTDGGMTIRTLIDEAVARYKKATNKSVNHKVIVHRLRSTANHNAILDEDDLIKDVADNRDQLVAEYDETPSDVISSPTSNSFIETTNLPKVYSANVDNNINNNNNNYNSHRKQIIGVDVLTDLPPEVFDGGENARLSKSERSAETVNSVAIVAEESTPVSVISHPAQNIMDLALDPVTVPPPRSPNGRPLSYCSDHTSGLPSPSGIGEPGSPAFQAFARNMTRKSLGNGLSMQKWYIAQERIADQLENSATKLLATGTVSSSSATFNTTNNLPVVSGSRSAPDAYVPFVQGSKKPLESSVSGPMSADTTDSSTAPRRPPRHTRHASVGGSLSVGSSSVTLAAAAAADNSAPVGCSNLNSSAPYSDLSASVISTTTTANPATTVSSATTSCAPLSQPCNVSSSSQVDDSSKTPSAAVAITALSASCATATKPVFSLSPPKQPAAGIIVTPPTKLGVLAPTNTRRIGNKITIDLVKGQHGLGFSITSRDNLSGVNCPIYIKNVLPQGAAIEDGRLKPGDRLLEVNDVKMTGLSQSEAANVLRNIALNETARLVVSRQVAEEASEVIVASPNVETETMKETAAAEKQPMASPEVLSTDPSPVEVRKGSQSNRNCSNTVAAAAGGVGGGGTPTTVSSHEHLTFHIALGEAGFASLGIKIMKKSSGKKDVGIFIKSVLIGGSAAKDGRLRVDDQLVEVNGVSLIGLDNAHALNTLRDAMQKEGRLRGFIGITIARPRGSHVASPAGTGDLQEVRVSQADSEEWDFSRHQSETSVATALTAAAVVSERTVSNHADNISTVSVDSGQYEKSTAGEDVEAIASSSVTSDTSPETTSLLDVNNEDVACDEMSPDGVDLTPPFQREGFGRQSISEKRKGHVDPKNLEVYQKIQSVKEKSNPSYERPVSYTEPSYDAYTDMYGSANSVVRHSTYKRMVEYEEMSKLSKAARLEAAMKKSKSLEDLQQQSQQQQQQQQQTPNDSRQTSTATASRPSTACLTRACGGNESFRAAVDRSYDGPESQDAMETVVEDAGENDSASRQTVTSTPRSTRTDRTDNRSDWSWGLLKGIAGIFRFNKSKRLDDSRKESVLGGADGSVQLLSKHDVREVSKSSKFYVSEDFFNGNAKPSDSAAVQYVPFHQPLNRTQTDPTGVLNNGATAGSMMPGAATAAGGVEHESKTVRMQELRRQHQRSHRERSGHYPNDDKDDLFEQQLKALEQQNQPRTMPSSHSRSRSSPVVQSKDQLIGPSAHHYKGAVNADHHLSNSCQPRNLYCGYSSSPIDHPTAARVIPKLDTSRCQPLSSDIYSSSRRHHLHHHSPSVQQCFLDPSSYSSAFAAVVPSSSSNNGHGGGYPPLRHNAIHVPAGVDPRMVQDAMLSQSSSSSSVRRSYRESSVELNTEGGNLQRFVSLPTRQRRRRQNVMNNQYNVAIAQSAQV